jgi:hypothetical protein
MHLSITYIPQHTSILLLPNQTRHKLAPTLLLRSLLLHKASTISRRARRILLQHNPRVLSGESRPGRGLFELERVRVSRAHEGYPVCDQFLGEAYVGGAHWGECRRAVESED